MISIDQNTPNISAIIGTQWGDEGKGKLVDIMAADFDIIARSSGGANAGHTIVVDETKYVFHLLPSGLLHPQTTAVIGNGTVVQLASLWNEIDLLQSQGVEVTSRIKLSHQAHLILPYHQTIDQTLEARKKENKIGTTGRGIGPCYTDKIGRIGVRAEDLYDAESLKNKIISNCKHLSGIYDLELNAQEQIDALEPYISKTIPLLSDTAYYLYEARNSNQKILVEGAQAHYLDIDHGTYPFVTSSSVSAGGFCTGLGLAPQSLERIIGVAKAYTTRVGAGPFPTEMLDSLGERLREQGGEYGATTGRPRRCGWFDSVLTQRAIRLNGITELNLTKLDVLTGLPEIKVATQYLIKDQEIHYLPQNHEDLVVHYETLPGWDEDISNLSHYDQLPPNAKNYIRFIEATCQCPVTTVGIGSRRDQLINVTS